MDLGHNVFEVDIAGGKFSLSGKVFSVSKHV